MTDRMVGVFRLGWVLLFSLSAFADFDPDLAPHLSVSDHQRIQSLLKDDRFSANLEANEMRYAQIIQRQIYQDLVLVYDPGNAKYVKTTYGGFTPEGERRGKDLGYGLHVIKRLRLPLPNGKVKQVDVNEHWAEHKVDHGLILPDEIRIKTLVKSGPREERGSEKLYLFDMLRVSWDDKDQPELLRRTKYNFQDGKNHFKQMRVPVSAPYTCVACHSTENKAADRFAKLFLEPGAKINHEQIVQDSHFEKPLEKTRGFVEYVQYLESIGKEHSFIERAKKTLKDPVKATQVPHLLEVLRTSQNVNSFSWMEEDYAVSPDDLYGYNRQGIYSAARGDFIDAIEVIPEGKYRWWFPQSVIPLP